MFYSNPTGCTVFFFIEEFLAQHVLETETDRAKGTVSQHQYLHHGINIPKPLKKTYGCTL
jgi:hypothetical protein